MLRTCTVCKDKSIHQDCAAAMISEAAENTCAVCQRRLDPSNDGEDDEDDDDDEDEDSSEDKKDGEANEGHAAEDHVKDHGTRSDEMEDVERDNGEDEATAAADARVLAALNDAANIAATGEGSTASAVLVVLAELAAAVKDQHEVGNKKRKRDE